MITRFKSNEKCKCFAPLEVTKSAMTSHCTKSTTYSEALLHTVPLSKINICRFGLMPISA